MKRAKNAQIIGQIFIYILALVVFTVILLYGYSAIKSFIEKGERVAFIQFKTKLETEIASIASQYGDVVVFDAKHPLKIPSKYTEVCFIDLENCPKQNSDFCAKHQIACASCSQRVQENVFLTPPAPSPIYAGPIKFDNVSFLCVNVTEGRLDMRMQGAGTHTIISP